jgi:hypothetical protein
MDDDRLVFLDEGADVSTTMVVLMRGCPPKWRCR